MDISFFAVLSVGMLALGIQLFLLVRPHNQGLLLWLPVAMLLWAVHYLLIGTQAAAVLHVLAAATMWTSHFLPAQWAAWRVRLALVFMLPNLVLGATFYLAWPDLPMILGNMVFAYAHFCLQDRALRWGYIVAGSLIGFGAAFWGSVPGVIVTVMMVSANLLAIFSWSATAEEVA